MRAALVWARNHMESAMICSDEVMRRAVVGRLNAILEDHQITADDVQLLEENYPLRVTLTDAVDAME